MSKNTGRNRPLVAAGQRQQWKQALAAKTATARSQRYRPRKTPLNVRAGMVRRLPTRDNGLRGYARGMRGDSG
jgi:hypothetical protein